ncbi:hypothetical protein D3C80_1969810 [compost metagenome]
MLAAARVWAKVGWLASHCWKASGASTSRYPRILKCPTPQNSAQRISYLPGWVGVNQKCDTMPGTISIFPRICGM